MHKIILIFDALEALKICKLFVLILSLQRLYGNRHCEISDMLSIKFTAL